MQPSYCSMSSSQNLSNRSQSSEDVVTDVPSHKNYLRDGERGSLKRKNMEYVVPHSSSSLLSGVAIVGTNQCEGSCLTDNMLNDDGIESTTITVSEQRSLRRSPNGGDRYINSSLMTINEHSSSEQFTGSGRNETSTSANRTEIEDSVAYPGGQQCEQVLVEDVFQRSGERVPSPESSGTQIETATMDPAQVHQYVSGSGSSSNADGPHKKNDSFLMSPDDFKGWKEGLCKTIKSARASNFQWPMWTVSYLLSSSTMDTVVTYYRILNLANDLNDKDLRLFLEEQLRKEAGGLSKDIIRKRLRTRIYDSSTELPKTVATSAACDPCSICMVEFKGLDKIASLYYCSHEYHEDCIKEWLLKSNICPLCRALAIIPEQYPDWNGDICLHRAFFMRNRF